MTDLHTAAKLALEALEFNCITSEDGEDLTPAKIKKAITALRQALEQPAQQRTEELLEIFKDVDQVGPLLGMGQPAQQEPIGYWQGEYSKDGGATLYEVPQESMFGRKYRNIPLYYRPQAREWVWLTAQELAAMAENVYGSAHHDDITFGVEIQAKLKERNT